MSDPVRRALSAGVGTPAYVYDLARVRTNLERLRAALPAPSTLYYSLKANPHPDLLGVLADGGARAEVCSPGELDAAAGAGWAPDSVLYTGPGKRDVDLRYAVRRGVREFSVDSPYGLEQLATVARAAGAEVRCLLRVNDEQPVPGQGLAMTGVASQFGADTGWVLAEPDRFASRPHLRVRGLHLYMGTNLSSVDALLAQFRRSLCTTATLRAAGVPVEVLDLGGGFGAPYAGHGAPVDLTGLAGRLAADLDEYVPGWRDGRPEVVFESGRYLVATAGSLVTTVLDVKRSHGREVVVLDSGINHLGGMSGLRRLPPLNPRLLTPADPVDAVTTAGPAESGATAGPAADADAGTGAPPAPTLVAGPLCTPLDTWSRAAPLPALRPGDLLVVPDVGAYGLYASLIAFLGHPCPVEVVVDGDRPVRVSHLELVRKD